MDFSGASLYCGNIYRIITDVSGGSNFVSPKSLNTSINQCASVLSNSTQHSPFDKHPNKLMRIYQKKNNIYSMRLSESQDNKQNIFKRKQNVTSEKRLYYTERTHKKILSYLGLFSLIFIILLIILIASYFRPNLI
jgi:hypothetical protein